MLTTAPAADAAAADWLPTTADRLPLQLLLPLFPLFPLLTKMMKTMMGAEKAAGVWEFGLDWATVKMMAEVHGGLMMMLMMPI